MDHTLFPITACDERHRPAASKILLSGIAVIMLGVRAIIIRIVSTRFSAALIAVLWFLSRKLRQIPDWVGMLPSEVVRLITATLIVVAWHELSLAMFWDDAASIRLRDIRLSRAARKVG